MKYGIYYYTLNGMENDILFNTEEELHNYFENDMPPVIGFELYTREPDGDYVFEADWYTPRIDLT